MKKKKGIGLLLTVFLTGFIPLLIANSILTIFASRTLREYGGKHILQVAELCNKC